MTAGMSLPDFDALPVVEPLGLRHAWDVFGPDDELGTVGLLTPEEVLTAVGLVRDGTVWSLGVALDAVDPPLYGRGRLEHTVFRLDRNNWDDRLDNLYLQASTHWDGLRHVQAREHGHWGGRTDETAVAAGSGPLGIEHWARRGLVGRGVLLDVAGGEGGGWDPFASRSVTAEDLARTAQEQGVDVRRGDILCLRLGWVGSYLALERDERTRVAESHAFAGLAADEAMARWLWDAHVAAVATDNPGVEVSPGDPSVGSLHRRLLPLLGMALGELFDFDALAGACRSDGRWDFLFVSVPLHLRGGVGSPANAVAIR